MGRKVVVVFFGPISMAKHLLNLASYNNEIIIELNREGVLGKLFCKDFSQVTSICNDQVEIFSGSIHSRVAFVFHKLFGPLFGISERAIFEKAFDLFVSSRINFNEFDTLFLLRETNERLCVQAKNMGKKVIGLASIYPLEFERQMIVREEKKWGIKEKSNYTDSRRVSSYNRILESWDVIIPLTTSIVTKQVLKSFPFSNKLKFVDHEFGVDRNLFLPDRTMRSERLTFMSTTDDTLKKGLPVLLEVWDSLPKHLRDEAKLIVVGVVGKNLKKIVDKFEALNVEFVGYSIELEKFYHASDVFISSSIIDMGPRTVKQAMSCGVPVIVTVQSGVSDFIDDNIQGFKYDVNKPSDLLHILKYCIEHKSELYQLGKNAFEKSRTFDNDLFAIDVVNTIVNID